MVKKPAGTLPVRKHKFASTPSTGQAITKFFDKKEEQARLQQQLAKPRPAGPPPTFSDHSAASRAQATHAAPAAATVTSAVPSSFSGGQPAVIHITSTAASHPQPQQKSHKESGVPIVRLPAVPHQSSKQVQQQPLPEDQFNAVNGAPGNVFAANVSAVGVKPPRQKSTTQPSLEFMMMSQDDDGCCIKWQASPQHFNTTTPGQGGLVSDALPNQDVTAMKQRLANAVQRTFVGSAESSKHSQSSEVRDTLLDDLLALPPPQHSRLQKVTSLDRMGTKVLSPTSKSNLGTGSGTPRSATKTPGTAGRGYTEGPRKRVTFGTEPESGTPGSMKTGSVFKKKRRLHQVNENFSGTGGKRSGGRKRNSTLIDLLDKVEVMIKSRNVRERLGSDQALQGLPAQSCQDAVLSQQAAMLHEMQNSQEEAANQNGTLAEPQSAEADDEAATEMLCERHTSQEAAKHQLAPAGPQESDMDANFEQQKPQLDKSADDMQGSAVQDLAESAGKATGMSADTLNSNEQCPTFVAQAASSQRLGSQRAASASCDDNQQRAPLEAGHEQAESATATQAHAGTVAATCRVNSSVGVLAQDFLDDLDPDTTEQLAEVERTAQLTVVTQHAQQAQRHQLPQQETVLPTDAADISAPHIGAELPQQNSAASQRVAQQQSMPESAQQKLAGKAQHTATQHSVFDFDDSFPDSLEFVDQVAQLMDSAAAPRPAGLPSAALAGCGPDSASSSQAGSRPNSAGSRQTRLSGNTPGSSPDASSADAKAPSAVQQKSTGVYSQEAFAMAVHQGVAMMHDGEHISTRAKRYGEGVLAMEPAGPAEHASQVDLPKLAGDRVHVHYQVKSVQQVDHEKVVHLEGSYTAEQVVVHLRDCWFDTPVELGHSVNLLAEKVLEGDGVLHAVCNFQAGMVILHPDLLLSGTRVSGSFRCKRQAVLEERFGGSSSDKAVEGTLLHELFQVALTKRITSRARLEGVARAVIAAATDKLLEVGLDEHKAMARLQQAMSSMLSWVQRFLRFQPAQNATVEVGPGEGVGGGTCRPMCVRQVADIEENVWAPRYGLKGMIDASLAVGFQPQGNGPRQKSWMQNAGQPQQGPNQEGSVMVPLEFKTGKPHISHRAQVSLYLLLMQERYGQVIESGLLWYLGSLSPQQVRMVPQEIQALIMHRNILAGHMMPGAPLPEVIRDPWACDKCFQKAACALSHKACERGNEESSGLGESYNELTGHITEASGEFFQHWLRLVELEEAPLMGKRAEIWASSGMDRERAGRCICGLIVDPIAVTPCTEQTAKAVSGQVAKHKLLYSFSRASQAPGASQTSFSKDALNEKGFTEGDMVILSIEGEQACVQRPVISSISAQAVILAVDKPLRGSMLSAEVRWRMDKDEVSSIFTRMRCNLLDLMRPAAENFQQARRLIADLKIPAEPCRTDAHPKRAPESPLNNDQQAAVNRVLSTPDYALILGMPGTGKTSTIVQAIKGLLAQGRSVLLTSYTNSAVDNVLLKLLQEGLHFLRLGRQKSVHPLLQAWTLGGERYPDTSVKTLRQLSETAQVVACTALGVSHCLLKGRIFDMCIVDEAGQMTLPVALGPILHSKAFTLVGDHFQLPPLVTSRAAEEGGLGISLFKRLCEAHPQMVASLTTQYRMAEDIMLLANTLVYKGQLRCGADHMAEAMLDLQVAPSQVSQPDWLVQVYTSSSLCLMTCVSDIA
ncbi:TPA: DNA replication endonuclease-helicase Dna2, variant 2 [Trebouxia sp. C0004]